MTKLKRVKVTLLMSTILLAGLLLVFTSCTPTAPATAPPAEPERMPPAVAVIPNVGTPRQTVSFCGANFEPGEEIIVTVEMFPRIETNLSGGAEGRTAKVDELGSFKINRKLPNNPGVYPVRVYDKEGKVIASAAVMVEE